LIQKNINFKKCPNRACLVISPTSIVDNWAHEVKKFTPGLKVFVHHGQDRPGIKEFDRIFKKKDIIITSYGLVQRDLEILQKYIWSILIIDEAQKIKNPQTKQSRSVKKLRASFKIAMTGTPVENNLWDLWSIMDFLNPGYLGHRREFKNAFAQAAGNSESGEHLKVRLKKLTSPLILRRNKGDKSIINDLPEKIENKIFCTLTMEQAALYRAVLKKSREHLEGSRDIQRKGVILSTLTKLKQICNHPAHYLKDNSSLQGRSGKFEHLMDMLDVAIQNGDRALIFTQYKEMGDLLQGYISSLFNQEIFYLHGGVPKNQRNTMVTAFQNNKKAPRVFILSLRAGGVGLNLTRANHVFHFDRWWNPAVENQATDRAYRIGQKRTVQVHKLICAGTLEENIDKLLFNKERIADDIVGTGENWLTKLSNNDLKELLALRIDTFKT
jgi:SNF2 family DNA or RNA helicase